MYWNHTNRNGTNKTTTTEFFFFLVSDFLIFGELFTHSHSFPLSDLNKYLMVAHFWWATWAIYSKGMSKSLAVLKPFEDKTWKFCWYLRNFYSLFLVVHWVNNFLNFWNIYLIHRYSKVLFSRFFNSAGVFENIFSQKLQCLKNFLHWIQIQWNF